ncbi:MAG: tRNA (adenosine(37)-N6)-dimethylallyltransferase MiaA [Clostridiales bacterium]|nr:tRNA (adenosine(37)-N6)-dimethylallyltransferase MiaA [Clostridiales bacterium]
MDKLIAIVGTNASGKSSLGVELALRFNGEIVSADSRQVYKGLDLGSGKITPEGMRGVPHHLLDVVKPGEFFSMADFQRSAYKSIDDITARGHVPFLVGGTGLYVDSVTKGYNLSDIEPDLAYREELETHTTPELWEMLEALEPGSGIDPKNRNRVMRRLEKLHQGDAQPNKNTPRYDVLTLGVKWDRQTLKERIDERLARRVDAGMIDEVARLRESGVSDEFLLKLGLEYRYVTQYLRGELADRQEMLDELSLAIKRFAKRQVTWFKKDTGIIWLDMEHDPAEQASETIKEYLEK